MNEPEFCPNCSSENITCDHTETEETIRWDCLCYDCAWRWAEEVDYSNKRFADDDTLE